MSDSVAMAEMPRYKCHKQVWALKIAQIDRRPDRTLLYFENKRYSPREVSIEYLSKHNPKEGGYYVQYEGGYESFSPADVFEAGYELIVN